MGEVQIPTAKWINKKSGKEYQFVVFVKNITSGREGEVLTIYRDIEKGMLEAMESKEFKDKFYKKI